ncbi:MAG TPA: CHRD domain-containing protein, partial [Opitutaceae bacterium]|nr:CHRD domain-containing protein [Opitutaceae bacterium]
MKSPFVRSLMFLGGFAACLTPSIAQVVEFRATINAAQENPATASTATGSAVMLYDVRANTFDLFVTLTGFTNTLSLSHVHEAAVGVNGPVVTNLGAEAVYVRTGTTLTGTFRNLTHGGDKLKLLQNGAYLNF